MCCRDANVHVVSRDRMVNIFSEFSYFFFLLLQLLWSFCYSQLEEAGAKPFRLTSAIPGATSLDYGSKLTFGESGLANSMISVAWDSI